MPPRVRRPDGGLLGRQGPRPGPEARGPIGVGLRAGKDVERLSGLPPQSLRLVELGEGLRDHLAARLRTERRRRDGGSLFPGNGREDRRRLERGAFPGAANGLTSSGRLLFRRLHLLRLEVEEEDFRRPNLRCLRPSRPRDAHRPRRGRVVAELQGLGGARRSRRRRRQRRDDPREGLCRGLGDRRKDAGRARQRKGRCGPASLPDPALGPRPQGIRSRSGRRRSSELGRHAEAGGRTELQVELLDLLGDLLVPRVQPPVALQLLDRLDAVPLLDIDLGRLLDRDQVLRVDLQRVQERLQGVVGAAALPEELPEGDVGGDVARVVPEAVFERPDRLGELPFLAELLSQRQELARAGVLLQRLLQLVEPRERRGGGVASEKGHRFPVLLIGPASLRDWKPRKRDGPSSRTARPPRGP